MLRQATSCTHRPPENALSQKEYNIYLARFRTRASAVVVHGAYHQTGILVETNELPGPTKCSTCSHRATMPAEGINKHRSSLVKQPSTRNADQMRDRAWGGRTR